MVAILMVSAKLATLGLFKIKLCWSKGHDIIITFHDITKKVLSRNSNYIIAVFMWPKFVNSNISMKSYYNLNFIRIWPEKPFFEGCSWFKFNNLGLVLDMALLQFYTSVANWWVKIKSHKVFEANSYVCKSYRRKTGKELFRPLILNLE